MYFFVLVWILVAIAFLVIIAFIAKLSLKDKNQQTCWAYCPGCKVDLCSEPSSFVSDTDLVRFICGKCHTKSSWLFDAPVPILIREFT